MIWRSKVCFSFTEIGKVRGNLFQINGKKQDPLVLPDAAGPPVTLSEKVYVPIKDYPEVRNVFKFVILSMIDSSHFEAFSLSFILVGETQESH